jgi:hypothetical protein
MEFLFALGQHGRQSLLHQKLKMFLFPEEIRKVGGQRVNNAGEFLFIAAGAKKIAVFHNPGETMFAHALAQTGFDEGILAIVQPDAASVIDQAGDELAGFCFGGDGIHNPWHIFVKNR